MLILPPDPYKYRFVHMMMRQILDDYSPEVHPKSIDEFVVDLAGVPALKRGVKAVGREIKQRIKEEIGDHLTVSVGVSTNRMLAKLAAGLHKPDGLEVIDRSNYWDIFTRLSLKDLPGIDVGFSTRLALAGIYTIPDMYHASLPELRRGFRSVVGEDWFARLRGWEVDAVEWATKSFSNQRVIHPAIINPDDILARVMYLTWKATSRMRINGFQARHVFFGFNYRPGYYWDTGQTLPHYTFSATEIFGVFKRQFYASAPREYVTQIFVGVDQLKSRTELQLQVFNNIERQDQLYAAIDAIEHKFGKNTIKPAIMLGTENIASHRIPFNSTKEMEQYLFNGDEIST
jgi:DNA polymerase-4